ncbi:hypothetical protein PRUPE_8G205300 [Prunus persica]|uniref:Uncharacterized protein n=1 Tax=Prunus persica TaxID=3760 RepID=A0A251N332_PRUPE|nr:hypothetical protein PRUPE_8G205300 [Prunus persica]
MVFTSFLCAGITLLTFGLKPSSSILLSSSPSGFSSKQPFSTSEHFSISMANIYLSLSLSLSFSQCVCAFLIRW